MALYKIKDISEIVSLHQNTIRKYESIGFLMPVFRKKNGYRVFNEIHVQQCILIKMVFRSEFIFGGLRDKAKLIIINSAKFNFTYASQLAKEYQSEIKKHLEDAKEALKIADQIKLNQEDSNHVTLSRSEAAKYLNITIDQMRNWELNGLVNVPKLNNGYRYYNKETINRLLMIKTLKVAKYSLSAILRVMNALDMNKNINIEHIIDESDDTYDFYYICDRLLFELNQTYEMFHKVIGQIQKIRILNEKMTG